MSRFFSEQETNVIVKENLDKVKSEAKKENEKNMSLAEQKRKNQRIDDIRVYITMFIIVFLAFCVVMLKISLQNLFFSLYNSHAATVKFV